MGLHVTAIVLTCGRDTRMKSALPTALHSLAGQPLASYAVQAATAAAGSPPLLLAGDSAEQVMAALGDSVRYLAEGEQRGTAQALLRAGDLLANEAAIVLVTHAEMPLLTESTLRCLVNSQLANGGALTALTVVAEDAHGLGRVLRTADGQVAAVVEEPQCTPDQLSIRELNAAVYCFDAVWLWQNLPQVPVSPRGEHCLADTLRMAHEQGQRVNVVRCQDASEVLRINTRVDLADAEGTLRRRINRQWLEAGVTMLDPATTYIDTTVTIGPDTLLLPNTFLWGKTTIGAHCRIGPSSTVQDSQIGDNCTVFMSVLEGAVLEEDANIGPFGHLRQGSRLCRGAHMGNFGEMKNSTLGPGAKMGHFSYLGDATIGANVNIGCGTITCNFDGEHKHPTVVEDDAFIGSDTMLVAPLHIGRGAKTGAGSVVTHDIPAHAVAYGVPARVKRTPGETDQAHAEE